MDSIHSHATYMQRAIDLSLQGSGRVSPNPLVGAVLVYQDKIIGEGYHQQYGQAHAEVNCIRSVSEENQSKISQSTLYVTLEPCSHFGKTPPCVDLILDKKIPKVVIGHRDPFEKVNGSGIEKLQQAGVDVKVGVLEKECQFANRRFLTFHNMHRPYVILKWAQSQDGFIAPDGDQKYWLTSLSSKTLAHQWRAVEDAILVGYNTVLKDNPMLTTRLVEGKNPTRIIIDKYNMLPENVGVFDSSAPTIIFNEVESKSEQGKEFIRIDFNDKLIEQILASLYEHNILSVIVEGGTKTLNLFLQANLWDEARVFTAPIKLIKGLHAPHLNIPSSESKQSDLDLLQTYFNQK